MIIGVTIILVRIWLGIYRWLRESWVAGLVHVWTVGDDTVMVRDGRYIGWDDGWLETVGISRDHIHR